ncbi:MAG: hypothetical protein K2K91_08065 [Ruminococcus sp.]|nr:hypothetical protein [Ruminococcus sp.]
MSDRMKIEKAHSRRYKKALVNEINYEYIVCTLYDIQNDCDEIGYYSKEDFEDLADILGNDETAYEFKMMFGTLSSDCYRLRQDLKDYDIPDYFDDFFVAVKNGNYGDGLIGYDTYENDYFGLDTYESDTAEEESRKRLQRLTKQEIVSIATKCFRIFMAFMGLYSRYQDLKASIDILKDRHSGLLQTIKQINELYEKASEEYFWGEHTKEFNRLLEGLPYDIWVQ